MSRIKVVMKWTDVYFCWKHLTWTLMRPGWLVEPLVAVGGTAGPGASVFSPAGWSLVWTCSHSLSCFWSTWTLFSSSQHTCSSGWKLCRDVGFYRTTGRFQSRSFFFLSRSLTTFLINKKVARRVNRNQKSNHKVECSFFWNDEFLNRLI